MTTRYLIVRDGREYFMQEVPPWAQDNPDYEVVKFSSEEVKSTEEAVPSLPSTDDTQERIQLMSELFELEEKEIANLKEKLEGFVETLEAIIDIAVPAENLIENKAKLLLINESCKRLLAPSD